MEQEHVRKCLQSVEKEPSYKIEIHVNLRVIAVDWHAWSKALYVSHFLFIFMLF